ncbi:flagellar biosynthesis protein FlhF [Candidatus Latescibacterota bacterium]
MIIKKFTAPTMTEALAKVRDELGPDAVILNTRSNRKGSVFDLIGRSFVEVSAAVDKEPMDTGANSGPNIYKDYSKPVGPADAKLYPAEKPVSYEPVKMKRPADVSMKSLEGRVNIEKVMADIKDLKRSVKVLADSSLTGEMTGLPRNLAEFLTKMQDCGFEDKIAKRVTHQLLNELSGSELSDYSAILDRAVEIFMEGIGDICPILFAGAKPRVVVFVGPTGSGKTTTIAKLATEFTLNKDKKVSVLTVDTKRIDAVGQLKSYCRIIKIPLHIAYSPEEIPVIMPKLMKSDLILVDTPGSGPLDQNQMMEMVEFLQKLVPQEVHLTLSVTTSIAEMRNITENFGTLKPNRILCTKLDETANYGQMLSFAIESGKPLSYVTFGQNVPGDFSLAEPESQIRKNLSRDKAI